MSDQTPGFAAARTVDQMVDDVLAAPEAPPYLIDVWRRFRKNRLAVIGLIFILVLVLVAIFAPLIAPYGPSERTDVFRGSPSGDHLFGTDIIGRDVFSRVVYGARACRCASASPPPSSPWGSVCWSVPWRASSVGSPTA